MEPGAIIPGLSPAAQSGAGKSVGIYPLTLAKIVTVVVTLE